eukprot:CAMPEP_0181307794 /NCGR_PEP_ID=MMETSP1101-20121128/11089_1 /TAXON_ID=46948 /ORGANISM="Rhodomonas abbreviata, Strain Caron Lab Isolate" /LENGTH=144 /DNA_ID=CAMNT_0023414073 /DNA_START=533 /DNA_END=967 /DNA_ORIENTATION=-
MSPTARPSFRPLFAACEAPDCSLSTTPHSLALQHTSPHELLAALATDFPARTADRLARRLTSPREFSRVTENAAAPAPAIARAPPPVTSPTPAPMAAAPKSIILSSPSSPLASPASTSSSSHAGVSDTLVEQTLHRLPCAGLPQ